MGQEHITQSITVAYSSLVLLILWYLFFILWRDYREQAFRQDLFELRSSLFDFAREGKIGFDSRAYRNCELTVNALIKYAYHVSFTTLVVAQLARMFNHQNYGDGLQEKIETDTTLSQLQLDTLVDLHLRLIWASAWHIATTSLLAFPCFIVLLGWLRITALVKVGMTAIWGSKDTLTKKSDPMQLPPAMLRHLQYVENQAVESERKWVSRVLSPIKSTTGLPKQRQTT